MTARLRWTRRPETEVGGVPRWIEKGHLSRDPWQVQNRPDLATPGRPWLLLPPKGAGVLPTRFHTLRTAQMAASIYEESGTAGFLRYTAVLTTTQEQS